jgi:hypothetical protein
MKVIIAGGRDFKPRHKHRAWLLNQLQQLGPKIIICGMAKGADLYGKEIADELNLTVYEFPAKWNEFGKSAGYRRNVEMAKIADACILFPGGKGTEHMRNIAIEYGLKLIEYKDGII